MIHMLRILYREIVALRAEIAEIKAILRPPRPRENVKPFDLKY